MTVKKPQHGLWFGRQMALAALGIAVLASYPVSPQAAASDPLPHRAIYRLALESVRGNSQIVGVDGGWSLTWGDACDGWTTQQQFQIRFQYAEGEQTALTTSYATWEAKDGSAYRFTVRKLVNGQLDEEVGGEAKLDDDTRAKQGDVGQAGQVRYQRPRESQVSLPPGTLFPTAHTLALIRAADKGEKLFIRPVFDGSEATGAVTVSAVIGAGDVVRSDKTAIDKMLAGRSAGAAWPVHMAFYANDPNVPTPEYETVVTLLSNGVVGGMRIDYGDFQVIAVLDKIETLTKPPC